jgi:hypothetical protein
METHFDAYMKFPATSEYVSILSPKEFKRECLGITKLCSDGYWIKLEF